MSIYNYLNAKKMKIRFKNWQYIEGKTIDAGTQNSVLKN